MAETYSLSLSRESVIEKSRRYAGASITISLVSHIHWHYSGPMQDTVNVAHATRVVKTDDGHYVAMCSCGWTDFPRDNANNASTDSVVHTLRTR
jgi:hypothetical protein